MMMPSVNIMIDSYNGGAYWQYGYDVPLPMQGEVLQYTGLKDKNGTEIYAGDIVRVVYDGSLESAGGDDEVRQVILGANDVDEYYPAFDQN